VASFSLAKVPWYGQLGIFVLASIGLVAAFYYLQETELQAGLSQKNVELTAVRARLTKGNATARQLPEFRAQIGDLEARLESLKPILPDEKDAGDLLRRIQELATQSNLQIRGFRPQAITQREMHAEWPISLQLEGTYHNLGRWLDQVSKFPRIINIGNLNLSQKDPPSGSVSMEISCTATTFVLDRPAEVDAKKKAAAKK
jgi:type IV pilus assembly protein PilO